MNDSEKQKSKKNSKIKDFVNLARGDHNKIDHVAQISGHVIQKASLISAHLLLPSKARVIDMGCGTGEVTYALALLNPLRHYIGIDRDANAIAKAQSVYKLPNLLYQQSDMRIPDVPDNSIDGIVNSNVLHEIYSEHNRDPDVLVDALSAQIQKLKPGGIMLIRDYMKPPEDEYVLLEFPDVASVGQSPSEMSYADLLVNYAQNARPMTGGGAEGFYLEELDSSILRTLNPSLKKKDAYEMTDEDRERLGEHFTFDEDDGRVFRLLHKWAVEFIHRKNHRENWTADLNREYTFYTQNDYRRELAKMGMRFVFSAPYRNPWVVDHFYRGRFHLYTEDARLLPPPATNYFIVAQKIADQQSLILDERRPSQDAAKDLEILTMQDMKTGALQEIARRDGEICDIIPYRITSDDRLVIYVRTGCPRPIVNAVKRGNANLDDKSWSGHLIEPLMLDTTGFTAQMSENKAMISDFLERVAKLTVKPEKKMYLGLTYFPSPDLIDEAIEPVFVDVRATKESIWDIDIEGNEEHFNPGGQIMELEANEILRAAQVGLLPEPRLEVHVFELMSHLGIQPPPWVTEPIPLDSLNKLDEDFENQSHNDGFGPLEMLDLEQTLEDWEYSAFVMDRKGGNHLKATRSVFVDEGKFGGAIRGMESHDYEFITTEDGIENIAAVVPLTRGWDDALMMGVETKNMSVPQRIGGSGAVLTTPTYVLPRDVRTIGDAKVFIAKEFGVGVDRVWQLGESYFTHTGVSPQRVFPFAVAADKKPEKGPQWKYAAVNKINNLGKFVVFSADLAKVTARVQMALGADHAMSPNRLMELSKRKSFELSTEKRQMQNPGERHTPLSRVLGQRDQHGKAYPAQAVTAKHSVENKADKNAPKVSLDKKPQEKLSLNFNPNEVKQEKNPETVQPEIRPKPLTPDSTL